MCLIIHYEHLDMAIWPYIVMGGVSLALLASFILSMKGGFFGELKRRFHAKID
jgi:hypothetical protein